VTRSRSGERPGGVTVVARYQVSPGQGDEVERLLGPHVAATRAEPGRLEFIAPRSTADPDAFVPPPVQHQTHQPQRVSKCETHSCALDQREALGMP
jgi:antibiotic biosynthesis monooxygenase